MDHQTTKITNKHENVPCAKPTPKATTSKFRSFSASHRVCYAAAISGHANVVRLCISSRADVHIAYHDLLTPLYVAAQQDKPECIAVLAAANACLEGAHPTEWPIGLAAARGADASVAVLAYLGARLREPSEDGRGDNPFWLEFEAVRTRVERVL